jgi:hypothetical protein
MTDAALGSKDMKPCIRSLIAVITEYAYFPLPQLLWHGGAFNLLVKVLVVDPHIAEALVAEGAGVLVL